MKPDERRNEILNLLSASSIPLSASRIAIKFNVSRQVIVNDIAFLRAEGNEIIATSQGYIFDSNTDNNCVLIIGTFLNDINIEEEMRCIIDYGFKIRFLIIHHEVYGVVKVKLDLSSRYDISNYIKKLNLSNDKSLTSLCDGKHSFEVFSNVKLEYGVNRLLLKELSEISCLDN